MKKVVDPARLPMDCQARTHYNVDLYSTHIAFYAISKIETSYTPRTWNSIDSRH